MSDTTQHLSKQAIAELVDNLLDYIKAALLTKSSELECPLEATIEMAIANFVDKVLKLHHQIAIMRIGKRQILMPALFL